VFYLNIVKVNLMLHMLQYDPPAAATEVLPSGRGASDVCPGRGSGEDTSVRHVGSDDAGPAWACESI
jgi:hypothetical protein